MGKLEGKTVLITARRDLELAAAIKEIERNVTGVRGHCRTLAISIASRRTSGARSAGTMSCSPMLA